MRHIRDRSQVVDYIMGGASGEVCRSEIWR